VKHDVSYSLRLYQGPEIIEDIQTHTPLRVMRRYIDFKIIDGKSYISWGYDIKDRRDPDSGFRPFLMGSISALNIKDWTLYKEFHDVWYDGGHCHYRLLFLSIYYPNPSCDKCRDAR